MVKYNEYELIFYQTHKIRPDEKNGEKCQFTHAQYG